MSTLSLLSPKKRLRSITHFYKWFEILKGSLRDPKLVAHPYLFIRTLYFFSFSCFISNTHLCAQEQTTVFQHIDLKDGLPEGQVHRILQDSKGFLWLGTMSGLARFDGYEFVHYTYDATDSTSLSYPVAKPFLEDRQGNIWVGTHRGLNKLDRKTNRFQQFLRNPKNPGSLPHDFVTCMLEDSRGTLWVGMDDGLARFSGNIFEEIALPPRDRPKFQPKFEILCLMEDDNGGIWAGSTFGLLKINMQKDTAIIYHKYLGIDSTKALFIYSIYKDKTGVFWLGTNYGLYQFEPRTQKLNKIILQEPFTEVGIRHLVQDNFGQFWLALEDDKGLLQFQPNTGSMRHFTHQADNAYGLSNNRVIRLLIDQKQKLWIGTYQGLNMIDLNSPRFKFLQQKPGIGHADNLIFRAHLDPKNKLWFTTFDKRMFIATEPGQKVIKIPTPGPHDPDPIIQFHSDSQDNLYMLKPSSSYLYSFQSDGEVKNFHIASKDKMISGSFVEADFSNPDIVWVSTSIGLCQTNLKTSEQQCFSPQDKLPDLANNFICNGIQLPDGYIYLHVEDNTNGRLVRFHKQSNKFELIDISPNHDGKSRLHIRQFTHSYDGTVWMATAQGLGRYSPSTSEFKIYGIKEGLLEPNLMGLNADKKGNIWFKSPHYLSKYHPGTDTFWHFRILHDMQEFNTIGATVGEDGHMVFHGNNGFYYFHPDSVRLDRFQPDIVLTDIEVNHESQHFGTSPELIREVQLTHRDNIIAFEFAALNVKYPEYCKYRYRLEGFESDWNKARTERKAVYTNLSGGKYRFFAQATNSDGVWSDNVLEIGLIILPSPWLTWWAKILYILFLGTIIYSSYLFQLRRRLQAAETIRLKELDKVKNRLFTNITHEFRSPLTVIQGYAEKVKINPEKWLNSGIKHIQYSSLQLLSLINQMLDLAKLDSGDLKLQVVHGNIVSEINQISDSLKVLAENKQIEYNIRSELSELYMDYDPNRFRMIFENLLSNAIKFTPQKGEINVSIKCLTSPNDLEFQQLQLIVSDTGVGIPIEKLPKIFNRFYQVDASNTRKAEGSGIGLSLAFELTKLMQGSLIVESEEQVGTQFILTLPISKSPARESAAHPQPMSKESILNNGQNSYPKDSETPIILVIEDRLDMLSFLKACLEEESYCLEFARDGQEGISKALSLVPDLIISDVMMPIKDGIQVCKTLKNDLRTSHIPIILLTAKVDIDSKLRGLKKGADIYLGKPFQEIELLTQIKALLDQRLRLQTYYDSKLNGARHPKTNFKSSNLESEFLQKVNRLIFENMDNTNFKVEQLSDALFMDRSNLFRKLKALTGKSTKQYMLQMRIKKVIELLQTTNETIQTIAIDTGFSDTQHLTKYFKKHTGKTPHQFRKSV